MNLRNNPIANYFKTSYQELVRVTWPSRQQAIRHSLTVIAVCVVVIVFLAAVDYLLNLGLQVFLNRL
jgi:preprotein translocase SecE subunit